MRHPDLNQGLLLVDGADHSCPFEIAARQSHPDRKLVLGVLTPR